MRNISQNPFLRSLPITAGVLADKLGISVVFGNGAYTNGKNITLPVQVGEDVDRTEILGFLIHEAGHCRFTTLWNFFSRGFEKEMINAIEDPRIEAEMVKIYPGAKIIFAKLYTKLLSELERARKTSKKKSASSDLLVWVLAACASFRAPEVFGQFRDNRRQDCVKAFGADVIDRIEDLLLKEFPACRNTEDVQVLARSVLKILQDAAQSESDQSDQSESSDSEVKSDDDATQGSSNGTSSSGCSDTKTDSGDEDGNPGESSDPEVKFADDAAQGPRHRAKGNGCSDLETDSGDAKGNSGGSTNSEVKSDDGAASKVKLTKRQVQTIQKVLKDRTAQGVDVSGRISEKITTSAAEDPDGISSARCRACSPKVANLDLSPKYKEMAAEVGRDLLRLAKLEGARSKKALTGLIQAETMSGSYVRDHGRRLETSRLTRLAMGSPKVFRQREEAISVDTSVSILLDLSGSMGGSEDEATMAALSTLTALRAIPKVKSSFSIFPGDAMSGGSGACISVVPFGVAPEKMVAEIGSLKPRATTPMVDALMQTSIELAQRPEPRKVIIIVTDGEGDRNPAPIIHKMMRAGMVVAAIGIGAYVNESYTRTGRDEFKFENIFPISVRIRDVSQLREKLMDLSKQILLSGIK